jgi:LysR family transcriptional regulator, low CO2-responsive transcriptional regulator
MSRPQLGQNAAASGIAAAHSGQEMDMTLEYRVVAHVTRLQCAKSNPGLLRLPEAPVSVHTAAPAQRKVLYNSSTNPMDFDQLITFLEVARQRSFSRAGEKVFRSQSAVSAQIRQLEQEYGDRLLDRSGKTVKLTPAGQIFYEYALRLKSLRDESLVAVADHGQTPRGTLMVGANEATCLYVLPEVFGEYCRHYPDVQISIYRNFTYKIVEKLENGSLDVGVLSLPVQSPSLKVQPIFRDRLMLMVSPKNSLAKMKSAHISEVVKHPLLLPKTGHTRRLLDKLFREYNSELKVRMELPSIGMIKSFVAADLGISLISASFARDEVAAGRVKLIELEGAELWRELGLAYRRDRTLSVAAKAFITVSRQLATHPKKTDVPAHP